jgi:hypothetical protein
MTWSVLIVTRTRARRRPKDCVLLSSARREAATLKVLRKAPYAGDAMDRSEFKEFGSIDDLQSYLNAVSEKIISSSSE